MATQKISAEYRLVSTFEIPADAQSWNIHWDKISYTAADGTEVEDEEPVVDCQEDHEVFHRPTDMWGENDDDDAFEPPEAFFKKFDDMKKSELVEMLWTRMSHKERREILMEMEEEDDEDMEALKQAIYDHSDATICSVGMKMIDNEQGLTKEGLRNNLRALLHSTGVQI